MLRSLLLLTPLFFAARVCAAPLDCAGTVAPILAYPDANGHWQGLEISLCQKLAAAQGLDARFTPIWQDSDIPPKVAVLFAPQRDLGAGYAAGPVIYNDYQAILVPADSHAHNAADLANAEICIEPGSPEEANLAAYFKAHHIPLHEFVFQETDEMHDAYEAGRCDAITARRSLLIGLRANAEGARQNDILLPDNLGNNPVVIATPAGQPDWTAMVAKIAEEK
jgi:general L-amino acid transport system substrate-binding protein